MDDGFMNEETSNISNSVQTALQSKLLNAKIAVQEAKENHEEKVQVIQNIVNQLQLMVMGVNMEDVEAEPHLVNLLEEEAEIEYSEQKCITSLLPPIQIESKWCRVGSEEWIIGIDICNISKKSLDDPHIIVTSGLTSISHSSKTYKYPCNIFLTQETMAFPNIFCESSTVMPAEKCTIVAVFHRQILQHFQSMTLSFSLMFGEESVSNLTFLDCGEFLITATDFLNPHYQIKLAEHAQDDTESIRDIIALSSINRSTSLIVSAKQSDVKNFVKTLCDSKDFVYQEKFGILLVDKNSSHKITLNAAWLKIKEHGKELKITAYTRTKTILYFLVHLLYKMLPEDYIILAQEKDSSQQYKNIISSMYAETEFFNRFVTKQINEQNKFEGPMFDKDSFDINACRANFSQQVENYKSLKRDISCNANEYLLFRKQLYELEKCTDGAISGNCNH